MEPVMRLRIPDSWQSYDLSGNDLAQRRAAVLRTLPEAGRRAEVNRWFRDLRAMLGDARRRGAVYAAGTVAMHDDGLLVATLGVFQLRIPGGRTLELPDLMRLAGLGGADPGREIRMVRLPHAGPAARIRARQSVPLGQHGSVEQLVVHTLVPLPVGRRLLLVTCASPTLALADPLADLFEAITDTLRLDGVAAA
jgi:hypothetical protein